MLPGPDIYIGGSEIDALIKSEKNKIKKILSNDIEISQFTKKAFNKFLDTKFKDMNKEFVNKVYSKIKDLTFKINEIQIPKEQVIELDLFKNLQTINFKGKLVKIYKFAGEKMGLESLKQVTFDEYDSENVKLEDIKKLFKGCKITIDGEDIEELIAKQ